MQGHVDEVEYLKNSESSGDDADDMGEETKEQLLKLIKERLFSVFFRLNTLKLSIAKHYYMLFIAFETFHLLSLVLVDGSYSTLGPYGTDSPWNLGQTQWLIDICWVFRVDRYLRTSHQNFIILISLWGGLIGLSILLGVFLGWFQKPTSVSNAAIRVMKICITLVTDTLFIPICDTFAFGINCSFKGGTECLEITEGYIFMLGFIAAMCVFLGVALLTSLFYYDLCMICGGPMAKPHPRFKLFRLFCYVAIIFTYYFVDISGKIIVFLVVSLVAGITMCYFYTQYIPYYNLTMCKIRLAAIMIFTSAVFCMLIGEFFKSTDQTNSSVTMLFYFLTPCLVQIMQLAMTKRGKALVDRKFQQITNIYQVEIKGRMLVLELEAARSRSVKSMYGEVEEDSDQEFKTVQDRILVELDQLYAEAFRKFPNSEFLYMWSGLIQLHMLKNYILSMVQCFKGLLLANKLDSQYALYHFRKTSESFYKANMKDDAYDYVLFEKCNASAQKNDETVTRSQFFFWAELESKAPKIQKLTKLASEVSKMVNVTKSNYQRLLKLNSKSTSALRMFGGFLQTLNNYADQGQRYLSKADMQDDAQGKATNITVSNSLNQPLSFFDSENSIVATSGDVETIGEITKSNEPACHLFGYLQAELVGRNISLIIPSPFSEGHNRYMQHFHESGKYRIIDTPGLIIYFVHKGGALLEARLLVKVLPNENEPPFLMAAIKPTKPDCDLAMLTPELVITAYTQGFGEKFDLGSTKTAEQKISSLIPNFEELRLKMSEEEGVEIDHQHEGRIEKLTVHLVDTTIGECSAFVLRVENGADKTRDEGFSLKDSGAGTATAGMKSVSTLKSQDEVSASKEESSTGSTPTDPHDKKQDSGSSDESESESEESAESSEDDHSDKDESSESSEDSESEISEKQIHAEVDTNKKITFAAVATPGMVQETGMQGVGNEGRPLIKRDMPYSDQPDILVDDPSPHQSKESRSINSSSDEEGGKSEGSQEHSDANPDAADAHSAYSSSKSMNSSMASLAQFNKAIKALIVYEFSKTKKYVLRFKITLFLTIIILIATSITTFKVIEASVTFNEQLSHYVNLVGKLRLYSQSVSYYSRMIQLIDSGMLQASRTNYFTWMTQDTNDMHDINLELYKNYNLLGSSDQSKYIAESISVWLLEGKNVREIKANLFDATSNLVLQAFLLQEELAPPNTSAAPLPVTYKNRRVFYLYRNGMGETLDYLNRSTKFYVRAALSDLENQRLISIMLIVVSVILLLFCAGFAIIPTIKTLESSKKEVWEIFFEIPRYVCRIMKGKCNDRLQLLNEASNIEMEEVNPDGEHEDEHQAEEAGQTRKSDGKSKEDKKETKKKKVVEGRRILAYDPRQRKIIVLKLFCFFVISLVYFYLIYYTGFEAAGQILKEEPNTIDWASRRRQLSRSVNHWVTESLLENVTTHGYKYIVPKGQQVGSPSRKATVVINELEYVENSLIFGNDEAGLTFSNLRGSEHDTLLFTDACIAPISRNQTDCETIADKAMKQGLHSALGMFITLARTLLLKIAKLPANGNGNITQTLTGSEMTLLRQLDDHYLYDALAYSSELYEEDYSNSQSAMHVWQNLLISLYTIFAVLFYIFVYQPMIRKIGQDTKDAWNMCTLIPQEYQEEFKKLNAAIKERRDNFKWR